MSLNRSDIQNQINSILKINPKATLQDIKDQLSVILDQTDLSQPIAQDKVALVDSVVTTETENTLSHDFMKQHILDDLNSYEGIPQ